MGRNLSEMSLEELWKLFPIFLVAHDDRWKDSFHEIEKTLSGLLSDQPVVRISHIGSTAIQGILAKNIVDVMYFKPETELNQLAQTHYKGNICQVIRQWHYSPRNNNSVDMMLAVNGIPLAAIELKNQLTGQNIDKAISQWKTDRDPKEECFQFNRRILVYFAVDLYQAAMATRLKGGKRDFLPFNQGSNGAGNDGGAGNPPTKDGSYVTSYLWKNVFQKDQFLDILQKFISYQKEVKKSKCRMAGRARRQMASFPLIQVSTYFLPDIIWFFE